MTALAAALLVLPATSADAQFSGGGNGVIAFTRDSVAYSIEADGSGLTRISDPTVGDATSSQQLRDTTVSYSADGSRIVFVRDTPYTSYFYDRFGNQQSRTSTWRQIWTANSDGSNAVQLTTGQAADNQAPAFSPDGSRIAWIRGSGLAVMNADGSGTYTLGQANANHPSFSPDGSRIVYYANPNGNSNDIFTIPVGGGGSTQLTSNAGTLNMMPDFSPDGTKIVFISNRVCDPYCYERVWLMDADGSNQHLLVHSSPAYDRDPQFSPDGTKVLYGGYSPDGNRLFLTDLTGSAVTQLVTGSVQYEQESLGINAWRLGAAVVPDTTPATATITTPADGASYQLDQSVAADYSCADEAGGSGLQSCAGTVASGSAIDTSTVGPHAFEVDAKDGANPVNAVIVHYTVTAPPGATAQRVSDGGTVSTGTTATAGTPVQTSITAPAGVSGLLSVTPVATTADTPVTTGFGLFGSGVQLSGPALDPATQQPYSVTFTIDASLLQGASGSVALADVQMTQNGTVLPDCGPAVAAGDACISDRSAGPGGDALVTVHTWHFSRWVAGRLKYSLTGPLAPVAAEPAVNNAKAGSTVPVKFKLGGDRGLTVLQAGTPTVAPSTACAKTAKTNAVQGAGATAASSLTYDRTTQTYTYLWRTTTKGCQELTLRLRDGTALRTLYLLS